MEYTFENKCIDSDGTYYAYFTDSKREMTAKDIERYKKIQTLPDRWRVEEMKKLSPEDNPNVMIINGRHIMEMVEKGFLPIYDKDFNRNHKLTFIHSGAYDFYVKYSKHMHR